MKFELSLDHITHGVRKDTLRCPIALCLAEHFPGKHVFVSTTSVYVFREVPKWLIIIDGLTRVSPDAPDFKERKKEYRRVCEQWAPLDHQTNQKVAAYDSGGEMKPFKFELKFEQISN